MHCYTLSQLAWISVSSLVGNFLVKPNVNGFAVFSAVLELAVVVSMITNEIIKCENKILLNNFVATAIFKFFLL